MIAINASIDNPYVEINGNPYAKSAVIAQFLDAGFVRFCFRQDYVTIAGPVLPTDVQYNGVVATDATDLNTKLKGSFFLTSSGGGGGGGGAVPGTVFGIKHTVVATGDVIIEPDFSGRTVIAVIMSDVSKNTGFAKGSDSDDAGAQLASTLFRFTDGTDPVGGTVITFLLY